jgi:hypothetical protein
MRIGQLTDNSGNKVNYIRDLKPGDKLIAKSSVKSTGDFGFSGQTYRYEAFIPGRIYIVRHVTHWDGSLVAYVSDEDGTLHFATPEVFDIYKEVSEIRDEKLNSLGI